MPKTIELTVAFEVQKVSCPGVWLCQDGSVFLTIYALGTSYQTCQLPPMFPLHFKDVFYFRKTFPQTCALNNISCLLKDEQIYCELIQWSQDCCNRQCILLAQYLGSLSDVLFPSAMCSNDGVDLLMKRSSHFPGILSPKIEIVTKIRIDELVHKPCPACNPMRISCQCKQPSEDTRQKPVCHSARYHRNKCKSRARSGSRSRSRSRSAESRSYCSMLHANPSYERHECVAAREYRAAERPRRRRWPKYNLEDDIVCPRKPREAEQWRCPEYNVYNVDTSPAWCNTTKLDVNEDIRPVEKQESLKRVSIESRYIDHDCISNDDIMMPNALGHFVNPKIAPCICDICKKYHEVFHSSRS